MAVYRSVQISFWQDPFILRLSSKEKFFYLYLMTNTKTSQCGIYELPIKIIEIETGIGHEEIEELLSNFVNYNKILYSEDTDEIMILNWIKFNGSSSPKVTTRVIAELKNIKNKKFAEKYIELSNAYGYELDKVSILYLNSMDTETQKKEKEKEKEEKEKNNPSKKEPKFFGKDDKEYLLALYLSNEVANRLNKPPKDESTLQKWSIEFEKMIRVDKYDIEEMKKVLAFSQKNDFWQSNILSASKFRKQYLSLLAQMERDNKKGGGNVGKSRNAIHFDVPKNTFDSSTAKYDFEVEKLGII